MGITLPKPNRQGWTEELAINGHYYSWPLLPQSNYLPFLQGSIFW